MHRVFLDHTYFQSLVAPYIAPPNLKHYIIDKGTVFIEWLPIPSSQVPGILRGYVIRYRGYFENDTTTITVDEVTTLRTITHLRSNSFYWLEVSGFTNAGEGPKSLVIINTPPGRKYTWYILREKNRLILVYS